MRQKKRQLLIVGLGNPTKKYIHSRHNLGFRVVTKIANKLGAKFRYSFSLQSRLAKIKHKDIDILLLLPQTFMNNSGLAVGRVVNKNKILLRDILVICDDLDLEFGKMRIRLRGSDAGHRGLRSIINTLNRQDFARLKIGIGRPSSEIDASDYVLTRFTLEQERQLPSIVNKAIEASICWASEGIETAMSKFN